MEILELKNTVTEIKAQQMGSTAEWRGQRKKINKLEHRTMEIIRSVQ